MLLITGNNGKFGQMVLPPVGVGPDVTEIANLKGAWGMIRRVPGYTGPAVRVKDEAGVGPEVDIQYDTSGRVTTAPPYADTRVIRIYDQLEGGHDLIQYSTGDVAPAYVIDSALWSTATIDFRNPYAKMFKDEAGTSNSHPYMTANPTLCTSFRGVSTAGYRGVCGVTSNIGAYNQWWRYGFWQDHTNSGIHWSVEGGGGSDAGGVNYHFSDERYRAVVKHNAAGGAEFHLNSVNIQNRGFNSPMSYGTAASFVVNGIGQNANNGLDQWCEAFVLDESDAATLDPGVLTGYMEDADVIPVYSGFVLDDYPSTLPGVGFRLIKSTYAGNCCKVRRASDDATQDIGFSGGVMDEAAMAAFCGASDGFIDTMYDQNEFADFGQTELAYQPKIFDGSLGAAVVNSFGQFAMDLAGAYKHLTVVGWNPAETLSVNLVMEVRSATEQAVSFVDPGSTNEYFGCMIDASTTGTYANAGTVLNHVDDDWVYTNQRNALFDAVYDPANPRPRAVGYQNVGIAGWAGFQFGAYGTSSGVWDAVFLCSEIVLLASADTIPSRVTEARLASKKLWIDDVPVAAADWRILISATQEGSYAAIGEIKLNDAVGGADIVGDAVVTESSHYGADAASKAVDGDVATFWASDTGDLASGGAWLQFQFPAAVSIEQAIITARSGSPSQSPEDFEIQYLRGATWITAFGSTGQTGWVSNEVREFPPTPLPLPAPSTIWRLSGMYSNSNDPSIAEVQFRESVGGVDAATGGTATHSTAWSGYEAAKAFDDDAATLWASTVSDAWLQYEFTSPVTIREVSIQARAGGFSAQGPNIFDLQYWDGAAWVTVYEKVDSTAWGSNEIREYALPT